MSPFTVTQGQLNLRDLPWSQPPLSSSFPPTSLQEEKAAWRVWDIHSAYASNF
jgi:hypothetical protein